MSGYHCTRGSLQQLLKLTYNYQVKFFKLTHQSKVDFYHLFERFESPFAFLPILQIKHLLKTGECSFRLFLF